MLIIPPLDAIQQVPWSMVIDKLLSDFDMLDLVFWFPRLSWPELGKAFGGMILCKCASDQIENWALAPLKARLKMRIGRCIGARWPRLACRLGWTR
jgi:hypothetical protein